MIEALTSLIEDEIIMQWDVRRTCDTDWILDIS